MMLSILPPRLFLQNYDYRRLIGPLLWAGPTIVFCSEAGGVLGIRLDFIASSMFFWILTPDTKDLLEIPSWNSFLHIHTIPLSVTYLKTYLSHHNMATFAMKDW